MKKVRIVIFAKAPLPGLAKTRLAPVLGHEGAAGLAKKLLNHSITQAFKAAVGPVELCVSPSAGHPVWREISIPENIFWSEQGEGHLGERLARATRRVTGAGEAIMLIGADCPALDAEVLRTAAQSLAQHQACMVPVSDGGYALLGLKQYQPSLFEGIPWSTAAVASLTRKKLSACGMSYCELPALNDIDEPEDLRYLPVELRGGLPDSVLAEREA